VTVAAGEDAQLLIVTGMSGAGKTTALRALDDDGVYCVDNLPPSLASATLRECATAGITRVALGMDVRVGAFLDAAREALHTLSNHSPGMEVIFLDAADEVLVRRFAETRRPHPMLAASDGTRGLGVADGVRMEREQLAALRNAATTVVDTTRMSVHDLRRHILNRSPGIGGSSRRMKLRVMSFGFKHGPPLDASVVIDVRFLDNPYFVPALKELTGNDEAIKEFVLASPGCGELIAHMESLLEFALPRYEQEGKSYLTVAVGCTGGRHRSVAISNEIARRLSAANGDWRIGIVHRDVRSGVMMIEIGEESVADSRPTHAAEGSD
jgi:UPF0042 nucleotide-binding protein